MHAKQKKNIKIPIRDLSKTLTNKLRNIAGKVNILVAISAHYSTILFTVISFQCNNTYYGITNYTSTNALLEWTSAVSDTSGYYAVIVYVQVFFNTSITRRNICISLHHFPGHRQFSQQIDYRDSLTSRNSAYPQFVIALRRDKCTRTPSLHVNRTNNCVWKWPLIAERKSIAASRKPLVGLVDLLLFWSWPIFESWNSEIKCAVAQKWLLDYHSSSNC